MDRTQMRPADLRVAQQLGLKPDDRLGFGVHGKKGRIIYATKRSNPHIAKKLWNDLIGRTATRRAAALAALEGLKARVRQLPKHSLDVENRLNDVRAQLAHSASVRASDYQALVDAIDRVEQRHAERQAQLKFDTEVQFATRVLMMEVDDVSSAFGAWAESEEDRQAIAGFKDFMKQASTQRLISGGTRPRYSQAQAFADSWLAQPRQNTIDVPRSTHLLDALAKLVLRGCNSPVPAPRHQPKLPSFSWEGETLVSNDGKRFLRLDEVQFAAGSNGSVKAYQCNDEVVVVKAFRESEGKPSRAEEALAEARVHWHANPDGRSAHIVGIRGTATTEDGRVMLVLNYAPHGECTDLMSKMDSKDVGTKDARMLMFTDMLKGAAEAHANGVMHLDLKPSNYFVGDGGELLLGDFGTSRTELVEIGKGGIDSVDYTAPELESLGGDQEGLITYKADVWALGVILYELNSPREANTEFGATALRPFPYSFTYEGIDLLHQFTEADRAGRFTQLQLDEGNPLHELIMKMLDPDPLNRPSLEEVLQDPLIQPYAKPGELEEGMVQEARKMIRAQAEAPANKAG